MLGNLNRRLGAGRHAGHIVLRHIHIDAQLFRLGDDEHFRAPGRAHVDQLADICLARRDNAVEGRDQALEAGFGDQPIDIGLCRLHLRHVGVIGKCALIDILFGDRIGAGERLPALGRDFRELCIGSSHVEVRARLHQLLVEIGRVDLGKQLARLDLAADVVLPALQVTGHTRVDGGSDESLQIGLGAPGRCYLQRLRGRRPRRSVRPLPR